MPTIITGNNLVKPITDATAEAADVKDGKVFYNNNGKQTGNGMFLSTNHKAIVFNTSTSYEISSIYVPQRWLIHKANSDFDKDGWVESNGNVSTGNVYFRYSETFDFKCIISLTVNGTKFPFPYTPTTMYITKVPPQTHSNYDYSISTDYDVFVRGNTLYVYWAYDTRCSSISVDIEYLI